MRGVQVFAWAGRNLCLMCLACAVVLGFSARQAAGDLYWDPDPNAGVQGGGGTWNYTTTTWNNGTSNQLWDSNQLAVFSVTLQPFGVDCMGSGGSWPSVR